MSRLVSSRSPVEAIEHNLIPMSGEDRGDDKMRQERVDAPGWLLSLRPSDSKTSVPPTVLARFYHLFGRDGNRRHAGTRRSTPQERQ